MNQYRKKPVVIEAVQWFKDGDHPEVKEYTDIDHPIGERGRFYLETLESQHFRVMPGDWIIKGVKGEYYACKPDIFALTYEPATYAVQEGEVGEVINDLARAATEIAKEGHAGWGNTCLEAAALIERQSAELLEVRNTPVAMWGVSINGLMSHAEFHKSFAEDAVQRGNLHNDGFKYELVPLYALTGTKP